MSTKLKWITAVLAAAVLIGLCPPGDKLSDLTIVQGAGFDFTDEGVTVTVQYLDLNKGTGKSDGIAGNITAVCSASGRDAPTAVENLQHLLPNEIYLSQCKLVIVGGSVAKEELDSLCAMMIDASELRLDTAVVRAANARQVLEKEQQNANVPAEAMACLLQREGKTVSVNQLLGMYCKGEYSLNSLS